MRQLKIGKSITNRESASLEKYLDEVAKEQLINADEEVILARLIKEGDQKALDKLTKANLRFVISVAKQYQNQGMHLPDLINEGNLGLIKAAQRFDETRGFKFISYAVWWIRNNILVSLSENSRTIRLPLNQVGREGKIKKAYNKLEQEFEREPTASEIAEMLGLSINDINDTNRVTSKILSFDKPLSLEEDSSTLLDLIGNDDTPTTDNEVNEESFSLDIQRVLKSITKREKVIIEMKLGIGYSAEYRFNEIAEIIPGHLTKERVRQIYLRGILKLKNNSRSKLLRKYLG